MFASSQFDNTGGGFVSSQSADPSSSSSKNVQPMFPVTVKQIIESSQSTDDKSSFLIDGADVHNVKLVGMVFDKAERVTDVSYVIDDGTGRIGCNRWINDALDTKEVEGLSDGVYVRVHGHLKNYQGKKQLVVFAIRPVTDYNEVANHFLECIYSHCSNMRSKGNLSGPSSTVSTTPSNGYQTASSSQFSQEYDLDGIKGTDKLILDYLQQPASIGQEKGVHRDEIARQLKLPKEKILEAIESLESEGLVYSTIDEYHYKSTAC